MDDKDKLLLEDRSSDLEFDEDITKFKCVQCGKVAINHFLTECHHVICSKCQVLHSSNPNYVCPTCQSPVRSINQKDSAFEEALFDLSAHCPNKKNGCKHMSMLIEIPGHLHRCKFTVKPTSPEIGPHNYTEVLEQLKILTDKVERLSNDVNKLNDKESRSAEANRISDNTKLSKEEQSRVVSDNNSNRSKEQLLYSEETQKKQVGSTQLQLVRNPTPRVEQNRMEIPKWKSYTDEAHCSAAAEYGCNLRQREQIEYNILLLGQTGVGKSTFINAFYNYLEFKSLAEAVKSRATVIIPCKFTITDNKMKKTEIQFGSDSNENMANEGQSSTQECREYYFASENYVLRIIDSPGIGDTRGMDQDTENLKNMFTFISKYGGLHAICILLKPNESRLTATFEFCIKQLLSQLQKDASKNIVFMFTNSRSTFYRPGDTVDPLTAILNKIKETPPNTEIPFNENNVFCLDNEAFRFLVALQNNIEFPPSHHQMYELSWERSVEECNKLIKYIVGDSYQEGLEPHNVQNSISISNARRAITDLSKPLSEVVRNIQDNVQVLDEHMKVIQDCKGDVNKLKDQLYIPVVTLDIIELEQPRTVCTSDKCRAPYKVGNLVKYHYPQKCHDPCHLKNVPRDVVGAEQLRYCSAISRSTANCEQCGCHYSKHLHIYYNSKVVNKKQIDESVQSRLHSKEDALDAARLKVQQIKERKEKYEEEQNFLVNSMAKLADFLKNNAIVVCNDAFEEYLKQLIENEKSLSAEGSNNAGIIANLKKMLAHYKQEKESLENALKNSTSQPPLTVPEVMKLIEQLKKMKLCGEVISQSLQAQAKSKELEVVIQKEKQDSGWGIKKMWNKLGAKNSNQDR